MPFFLLTKHCFWSASAGVSPRNRNCDYLPYSMNDLAERNASTLEATVAVSFAGLSYSTANLGDEIQTIAADRFVGQIEARFDRDHLKTVRSDRKYVLILNGWYSENVKTCFPPAECFIPVIIGFHISEESKDYLLSSSCLQYFKQHEPIGCRDSQTMKWLKEAGVDAYLSKCLTLTLPKRPAEPKNPKVIIVDLPAHIEQLIPPGQRKDAVHLTHELRASPEEKLKKARWLLEYYRDNAGLVITSKLHCALPCLAVGIPVVFFGDPGDYRLSVASSCGLRIHRTTLLARPKLRPRATGGWAYRQFHRLNGILTRLDRLLLPIWYGRICRSVWHPCVVDIEKDRRNLEENVRRHLNAAIAEYSASKA